MNNHFQHQGCLSTLSAAKPGFYKLFSILLTSTLAACSGNSSEPVAGVNISSSSSLLSEDNALPALDVSITNSETDTASVPVVITTNESELPGVTDEEQTEPEEPQAFNQEDVDSTIQPIDHETTTILHTNEWTWSQVSGSVVIEAESFDTHAPTAVHSWQRLDTGSASDSAAMVASPNIGATLTNAAQAPRLDYRVYFETAGQFDVWVRGQGDTNTTGVDDSLHMGVDGVLLESGTGITQFPDYWAWSRETMSAAQASVTIVDAGLHTINIWMREDGFKLDKLVIVPAGSTAPTESGPLQTLTGTPDYTELPIVNQAPVVTTGPNLSVFAGENLTLSGNASDDGLPLSSLQATWKVLSGPGQVAFAEAWRGNTTAAFSAAGHYVLEFSAFDGELSHSDTLIVSVEDRPVLTPVIAEPADTTANGGSNNNDSNNDNGPASPVTNTVGNNWQNAAARGNPVARHEAGSVVHNGKIYLMGGRGNRPVRVYNPSNNTWSNGGNAPMEMHHFQPVSVRGKIYVIGAMTCCYPNEEIIENVWIYNPSNKQWSKGPTIPRHRRRGSTGVVARNNKVYILGGNRLGHKDGAVKWFDEFDPATGKWKILPDAPNARDHFQAAMVGNKLVAAGGRRSAHPNTHGNMVGAADVYNFSNNKWQVRAAIPTRRAGTMSVSIGDEVFVLGGESKGVSQARDQVEAFNVNTGRWRSYKPMLTGRHGGGAAVLNGQIHAVSGNTTIGGGNETTEHEKLRVR